MEDPGQHGLGEAAGLGVLLTGVVTADEGWVSGEGGAVSEGKGGFALAFDG